uniref:C3H1-type domain-containing protein n=1 Tax=Solanum lycopersicum TaxID=4081 RepID=A0A3Q7IY39_SOLLC
MTKVWYWALVVRGVSYHIIVERMQQPRIQQLDNNGELRKAHEDHHRTSIDGSSFSWRATRQSSSAPITSRRCRHQLSHSLGYCKNGSSFRFLHGGGPCEGEVGSP